MTQNEKDEIKQIIEKNIYTLKEQIALLEEKVKPIAPDCSLGRLTRLEAMGEQQVTVDGQTHPLELPFLCIATQNPVEFHGTYPLPEAQLDRFSVRLTLGYVSEG